MKPALFMGDPSYFRIRGGHNPHTRTRFGRLKKVDRERAIRQWHTLAKMLVKHGALVFVMPPVPEHPGTAFPANAGFMTEKCFYLSNLIGRRQGERKYYQEFLKGLGVQTKEFSSYHFEGEADFFPTRSGYLFTFGKIERQRFVFRFGIPPYRRLYGFRSEIGALKTLESVVQPHPIIPLELVQETHYHGDTCAFAFGKEREYLAVYLEAFSKESQERLKEIFGNQLLVLGREDGERFAANSLQLTTDQGPFLFMPEGCSEKFLSEIRARGVTPVLVDVSEFMQTGGGSVKCLIATLGPMELEDPSVPLSVLEERRKTLHHQGQL